jgi:uncharacterized membrane protein YtjA (UPF0391 family)
MKYLFIYTGRLFMVFVWLIAQGLVFLWHLNGEKCAPLSEFCKNGLFGGLKIGMVEWTVIFLFAAIIFAIFGFGFNPNPVDAVPAKILFFIFLVLFVLSLIAGGFRRVD